MKERKQIGQGFEHRVVVGNTEKPTVLKIPRLTSSLSVRFSGGPDVIRNELEQVKSSIQCTSVKVPETRVFPFGNSYIIAQEHIIPDLSVDIQDEIRISGSDVLKKRYKRNPRNFIASHASIYLVDTTAGALERLLIENGIVSKKAIDGTKDRLATIRSNVKKLVKT